MSPLPRCLLLPLLGLLPLTCALAQGPRNIAVRFNGETEALAPLALDTWHTVQADYRYPGGIEKLTNTFVVIARGSNLLAGLDLGYNLPANQLMIIKHGFWNATEATGRPGESGKIIENDQAYLDCEHSTVTRTADEISVSYRLKFKREALRGTCNAFMYIEDRDVRYEGFTAMGAVAIGEEGLVLRSDMPAAWRNTLQPPGKPSEPLLLAEGGRARYRIVVPQQASGAERKAAADLSRYLGLISGAEFAVVAEDRLAPGGTPTRYLSVGRTRLLAASACRFKRADLAVEGYALEVQGPQVYLYGGSGRGPINAVYALLEEDLGCRWYGLDTVDTPSRPSLRVGLVSRSYVPPLELRDPYIHRLHDPGWSLRNRTNTPHARIPLAWGGSLRYHLMGHTYATYFPTAQYFADHPEYYALVNGKRQPSQLCQTNEDVIRLSIEKTCDIFRNHPDVTITAIGPNDGRGFCDCPACSKLNAENGGRSGSYFYFLNRIAAGVKQQFPHNRLISLAYLDYAPPPTHLQVDPYIIIQLCSDAHAWRYQFCPVTESREFQDNLKAWHARGATIYLWDYTTDYVHYLVPMANWAVVAANTRFNVRNGVRGIMYESELNDCDELRGWVWAKQLWNPALDTRQLLHDFVFGYYKEAAAPLWDYQLMLWDYWEKWHRRPHTCGVASDNPLLNNLQCSYAPDGPMFTPAFMAGMARSFAAAEKLAASDVTRERVRRAKLPLLYLQLAQGLGYYSEFGDFIYGTAMAQPPAERAALRPLLDQFAATCKQAGLSSLGIPITVEKITGRWQQCLAQESTIVPTLHLPAEWLFRPDAGDRGVGEKWWDDPAPYAAAARLPARPGESDRPSAPLPAGLARLHINRGVGWEQQGFPGLERGWYFQTLTLPPAFAARQHLYLHFTGVNEQAWVYLNGELAYEHTCASTGKGPGELAGRPFSFEAGKWLKPGEPNRLAIRVAHTTGLGGVTAPAVLIGSADECTPEQLANLRH